MTTKEIQDKLKKGHGIATYNEEELKYLQTPIGKEIYKNAMNTPQEQYIQITTTNKMKPTSRWNDRVKCTICGKIVSRSNQSNHRKSNQHQIYLKMNEKIRKLLID